jgi:hypothetical protein
MDISHLLNQTVGLAARTSVSSSGEPSFGSVQTLSARVESKPRTSRGGSGGDAAASTTEIWLATQPKVGDRIWLPGKDTTKAAQALEVLSVDGIPDLDGVTEFWRVSVSR